MSDEFVEEVKESGLKAKTVSLISKIIGGSVILIGAVLKWLNIFPNCEIKELCIVGFSIMGVCGTIDLNILIDKFTK